MRDFARDEVAPVAEELDRDEGVPLRDRREARRARPDGHPVPEEYGGGGADTLSYALAVEELARVDSSVVHHGRRPHLARDDADLPLGHRRAEGASGCRELCAGERLAAFGLTEPEAGSDAGNTRTRARLDDGEWVIDGAKQFITNSGTDISGCVTITASPATGGRREISNIIVPQRHPRLRARRAVPEDGLERVRHAAAHLRRTAACPRRTCSAARGDGFKQFLHILDGGRIGVAAMGVGLAQGALDEALAYAKERRAFGQPISKFQAIQAKIADISAEIEAARLLTYKAAIDEGPRRAVHAHRRPGEAEDRPARGARRRGGGPDPRRLRLHRGVPGLPLLPRRQDPHDRRGHRRGAADGDRPPARLLDGAPSAAGELAQIANSFGATLVGSRTIPVGRRAYSPTGHWNLHLAGTDGESKPIAVQARAVARVALQLGRRLRAVRAVVARSASQRRAGATPRRRVIVAGDDGAASTTAPRRSTAASVADHRRRGTGASAAERRVA